MARRPSAGGGLAPLAEVSEPYTSIADLPTAWDPSTPEPRQAEALLARRAQRSPRRSAPMPDGPPDGACGLLAAFASGATTPAEVLRSLGNRITASSSAAVLNPVPGAMAAAEESTRRWQEGRARPLEGLPFGVKDIIDVEAAKVTCGSLLTGDRVAVKDATVVARLRGAGAVPYVMLATTEFACGSPHNSRYGAVRNPYDPERWTGGSSTGSAAALAARLVPLALGTDTAGSIRAPSAWCGVTGLKPTRERVSRQGVTPLSWTLDHVGPMARSAADLASVLPWMADEVSPFEIKGFSGLRVGVPTHWFQELSDSAVLAAWREALALMEARGARLVDVDVDVGEVARAHADGWTILLSELASLHAPAFDRHEMFDPGAQSRILQGRAIPAHEYLTALRRRPIAIANWLAALDPVDVLVTPGVGGEAGFLVTHDVAVNGSRIPYQDVVSRNTMIFDHVGLPALMLPSGVGATGLPVAIQIVAKPYEDELCLAVGVAFQALTHHHLMRPPEAP